MGNKARLSVAVLSVAAVASALAGTAGAAPPPSSSSGHSTVSAASPAAATAAASTRYTAGRYLVTFADEPAASYTGYAKGFKATRPAPGKHLNAKSAAVKAWRGHLVAKHDRALAKVGATKIYDYTVANNGVAVKLSRQQAYKLSKIAGVVALRRDQKAKPDTSDSPTFLGLTAPGGLWDQLGGQKNAGAGVVVGVIDTGIWPESKAFAGKTGIPVPADWNGKCVAGEQFPVTSCNDKLIGARYFVEGLQQAPHRQGGVPLPARR